MEDHFFIYLMIMNKTCEINSIHFHQVDIECDVFDYYFTPKIQDSNSIFYYELISYN